MLKRLRELKSDLTETQYFNLVTMVYQDIEGNRALGGHYDENKIVQVINATVPIVKREFIN